MEKNKKRKWKYRINKKRKILVLVILGVLLFVGIGYSFLETTLGIGGTLEVAANDMTLYGILKKEASRNGIAAEYTGNHQDSMVAAESTEKIYHWKNYIGSNNAIQDKYNVVFNDICWGLVRTTDKGGVKLLYNGDAIKTDNGDGTYSYSCDQQSNSNHLGIVGYANNGLTVGDRSYVYSSGFTYDTSTKKFTLNNDESIVTKKWDDTNYTTLLDMYTCKTTTVTTANLTCGSLYHIESYDSSTKANATTLKIENVNYSGIGSSVYNSLTDTFSATGYKYGYKKNSYTSWWGHDEYFDGFENLASSSITPDTTYYYGDGIEYVGTTYNLTGTVAQITEPIDYDSLVGKYLIKNNSSGGTVYYLVGYYNQNQHSYYYTRLTGGDTTLRLRVGDDLRELSDGTFELTSPRWVTYKEWFDTKKAGTNDNLNKYICPNGLDICDTPRFIKSVGDVRYDYLDVIEFTFSKTHNDLELLSPQTVRRDVLYKNYNTYKDDLVYTCGNADTVCQPADLRKIYSYNASYKYNYYANHYYGTSVTWTGTEYQLNNMTGIDTYTDETLYKTHHYTCVEEGATTCEKVAYVHYINGVQASYLILENGETNVEDNLEAILEDNTYSSPMKVINEAWYKQNLIGVDNYIDDTIYCVDRRITNLEASGLNPNGGDPKVSPIYYNNGRITDLSCPNETDRFSVSNNKAKLENKIGLLTASDLNLWNELGEFNEFPSYWLLSPSTAFKIKEFYYTNQLVYNIKDDNAAGSRRLVRPSITLVSGLEYLDGGTGTKTNPYVVDMNLN